MILSIGAVGIVTNLWTSGYMTEGGKDCRKQAKQAMAVSCSAVPIQQSSGPCCNSNLVDFY